MIILMHMYILNYYTSYFKCTSIHYFIYHTTLCGNATLHSLLLLFFHYHIFLLLLIFIYTHTLSTIQSILQCFTLTRKYINYNINKKKRKKNGRKRSIKKMVKVDRRWKWWWPSELMVTMMGRGSLTSSQRETHLQRERDRLQRERGRACKKK